MLPYTFIVRIMYQVKGTFACLWASVERLGSASTLTCSLTSPFQAGADILQETYSMSMM